MSTGINYVQDIIDRNCNPVILEVKPFDDTEEARERICCEYCFMQWNS